MFKILSKSLLVASFALASMTALASSECQKNKNGRIGDDTAKIQQAKNHIYQMQHGKQGLVDDTQGRTGSK